MSLGNFEEFRRTCGRDKNQNCRGKFLYIRSEFEYKQRMKSSWKIYEELK